MPVNILDFPTYIFISLVESEYDYHIDPEARHLLAKCQVCRLPDSIANNGHGWLLKILY